MIDHPLVLQISSSPDAPHGKYPFLPRPAPPRPRIGVSGLVRFMGNLPGKVPCKNFTMGLLCTEILESSPYLWGTLRRMHGSPTLLPPFFMDIQKFRKHPDRRAILHPSAEGSAHSRFAEVPHPQNVEFCRVLTLTGGTFPISEKGPSDLFHLPCPTLSRKDHHRHHRATADNAAPL